MSHVSVPSRTFNLTRVAALALSASLLPLSAAVAQSLPQLRITDEGTEVRMSRGQGPIVMRPDTGTVLDMIDMEGDRYEHRSDNWYLVVLPRDAWGSARVGWVSGADSELLPMPARPTRASVLESMVEITPGRAAAANPAGAAPAAPGGVAVASAPVRATNRREFADVVLRFHFGKADLTEDAKAKLSDPAVALKDASQGLSFAIEGHADWVGSEAYNEKLGLARAESVKKFLAEEYKIAPEKISVTSFGEAQPATSNQTSDGRAENRRVVVKIKP